MVIPMLAYEEFLDAMGQSMQTPTWIWATNNSCHNGFGRNPYGCKSSLRVHETIQHTGSTIYGVVF